MKKTIFVLFLFLSAHLAMMAQQSETQIRQKISQAASAMKTMQIIGKLRETDGKLKGVKKGNLSDGDLMRELVYFILH